MTQKKFFGILTKTSIGNFYTQIDHFLKAKSTRADNIYRFVDSLAALPPDQLVNYRRELLQKREIEKMKLEMENCSKEVETMCSEFRQVKEELKCSQDKLQRTEKVLKDVSNQRETVKKSRDFIKNKLAKTAHQYESLEEEFAILHMENFDLCDDLKSQEHGVETVATKQGQSYTPEIRKLYYSLLADQIPATKIASVIQTVLKTFNPSIDVENLQLPKHTCASYMRKDELTTINMAHKATILCEASSFDLNTDGTTKNQKKLGGVVINDMVVSVNHLPDGTAATVVDDISKELKTLRDTARALGIPNANSINWTLIASSSSDSASTQKRVNKLIEERREEDARTFGVATAETVDIIENFCSMHLGVNLRKAFLSGMDDCSASDTTDALRKYHQVDSFVHEFCKLFGQHGTPEYTCGVQSFPDFLQLMVTNPTSADKIKYFKDCATIKLDRQVGSRYFVTAANASKIVFLKDAAIQFLVYTGKSETGNKLEKDVFSKLQDPLELVALRADSLMYFHIYADLIMLSKSKDLGKSAMDMNQHYLEMKVFLGDVLSNVDYIFNQGLQVFKSEKRLYDEDMKKTNHRLRSCMSTITVQLFKIPETEKKELKDVLMAGAAKMLDKLCSYAQNQLPGGIYWEPEQSIQEVLGRLKPTNDVCESVLGLNDYLTTAIPNLHQAARSNLVQAKKNKCLEWLKSLPENRQTSIVNLAIKERKNVSEKCKTDDQEKGALRQQIMLQAHLRRQVLKKKHREEKDKLSQQHLITSSQELFDIMEEIDAESTTAAKKKSKKLTVIRTQIGIRKKILKQNINILLTRSRKQRPVDDILEELTDFIRKNSVFSEMLQHPHDLIGSRIKHRFEMDEGIDWYSGIIVGYDSTTRKHEVSYDEEEDHCFFDLTIDIANNDLLIDSE